MGHLFPHPSFSPERLTSVSKIMEYRSWYCVAFNFNHNDTDVTIIMTLT